MINNFSNEFSFLSNFHPSIVKFNNLQFKTVEHAFVAAKSSDLAFHQQIQRTPNPGKAKRLGRKIKLPLDWDKKKKEVMFNLLKQKFKHPNLRLLLNLTKGQQIEEGNHWHDNIWGNCSCDKCKNKEGQNLLGKMLMKIRDE
jgi:ribA/ribD-fused uncharacterized protein